MTCWFARLAVVCGCLAGAWTCWAFWLPQLQCWFNQDPVDHMDSLLWLVPTLWICLTPFAIMAAWIRGSEIADRLHQGELASASAEPIRRAIARAAVKDARVLARRIPSLNRKGAPAAVAVDSDHRARPTRWLDERTTPASSDLTTRLNCWGRSKYLTITSKAARIVVVGGSGSGKTTAVRVIVDRYLQLGHRVLFLDGKGDIADQRRLVDGALARGRTRSTASRCGLDASAVRLWPDQPYDAWRGGPTANEAKLNALFDQPTGDASYHHNRDLRAIRMMLDSEPLPTSSRELLARLRNPREWVQDIEAWRFIKVAAPASGSIRSPTTASSPRSAAARH